MIFHYLCSTGVATLRCRLTLADTVNPERWHLTARIQLTAQGVGCKPGLMRSYMPTRAQNNEIVFTVPNPDIEDYQAHILYRLIDEVTGYRNNWHIHHAENGGGQVLICVAGKGFYKEEGSEVQELKPGVVVEIPPNVKHWHGTQKDSWFSHISVEVPGEETSNEWLEPVSDEYYNQL